jgi:hypothetical protein
MPRNKAYVTLTAGIQVDTDTFSVDF